MSDAQASDGLTAGAMLRRAREAAGLHVAALAVGLKVPVRKLEALEDDRYDLMPDNVFVRALASSVCRTLKLDPQPVLDRLPQTTAPRLMRDNEGLNAPFRAPSDVAAPSWSAHFKRPVFLVVFVLLLGALVVALLPATQKDDSPAPAAPRAAATSQQPVAPAFLQLAVAPDTAPAAAGPAAPASAVPVVEPAPAVTAASGMVVFRAKGPSWVEVTDAKGVVALRKVLVAGEAAAASGPAPLNVTIGRVDFTEVQVRGKPFDLKAVSRDNVARFEVK